MSLFFVFFLMFLLIRGVGFLVFEGIDDELFSLFLSEDIFVFFVGMYFLLILFCWLLWFLLFDVDILFLCVICLFKFFFNVLLLEGCNMVLGIIKFFLVLFIDSFVIGCLECLLMFDEYNLFLLLINVLLVNDLFFDIFICWFVVILCVSLGCWVDVEL